MDNMETIKLKNRVSELEKKIDRIESIHQIATTASNATIVDIINKITNSMKRKR